MKPLPRWDPNSWFSVAKFTLHLPRPQNGSSSKGQQGGPIFCEQKSQINKHARKTIQSSTHPPHPPKNHLLPHAHAPPKTRKHHKPCSGHRMAPCPPEGSQTLAPRTGVGQVTQLLAGLMPKLTWLSSPRRGRSPNGLWWTCGRGDGTGFFSSRRTRVNDLVVSYSGGKDGPGPPWKHAFSRYHVTKILEESPSHKETFSAKDCVGTAGPTWQIGRY